MTERLLTGIPYIPPHLRWPDGYMDACGLDKSTRKTIYAARASINHIHDCESWIFQILTITLPSFQTEDKVISGKWNCEVDRADIDGLTVIEDIRSYSFNFEIKKDNLQPWTVYGWYDQYRIVFQSFNFLDSIGLSEPFKSKLENKIKDRISDGIKRQHEHTYWEH